MKKVTIALPSWIGQDEVQDMVVRDLRANALLKLEFYRSKMKSFEAKYATTFPRFQRRVEKAAQEDLAAWDDFIEWEASYRGYQEWKKRHAELRHLRRGCRSKTYWPNWLPGCKAKDRANKVSLSALGRIIAHFWSSPMGTVERVRWYNSP
jgi:hypothetical protein